MPALKFRGAIFPLPDVFPSAKVKAAYGDGDPAAIARILRVIFGPRGYRRLLERPLSPAELHELMARIERAYGVGRS